MGAHRLDGFLRIQLRSYDSGVPITRPIRSRAIPFSPAGLRINRGWPTRRIEARPTVVSSQVNPQRTTLTDLDVSAEDHEDQHDVQQSLCDHEEIW